MRRHAKSALAGLATAAVVAALVQQPAQAVAPSGSPQANDHAAKGQAHRPDNRPGPLTKQQDAKRRAAVTRLRTGKAELKKQRGGGATVTLADGKEEYFPTATNDKIFTVLSQFGDKVDPKYQGTPGPVHNQIPEPDRAKDNSTIWSADFNRGHYEEMFDGSGESMKNFYEQLSSGRYSVTNTVEDWVTVPYNAAYYGANPREDEGGSWDFINDTGDSWYDARIRAGKSPSEIDTYLSQFDEWDRYDYDGDNNYNEPDGYIDHFQAIHSGEGEEAGASPDTIWSHRWYVNGTDFGKTGPTVGDGQNLMGGAQIGGSKYFLGDYTVEPENGGLGVFTHEFGHDLGLPDFYDTAGGDNGTGFWTLMSAGSWLSHGSDTNDGIGATPGNMGPEEKLNLGWLDVASVDPGEKGTFNLGPAAHTYDGADQAVSVNLPNKTTTTQYVAPHSGTYEWWSGRGDNVNNTLTRSVAQPGTVTVDASAWYSIEQNYDYLYAEYSTDNGTTWQQIGKPVTGPSGAWTPVKYTYDATGPSLFRFRYQTDGGVNLEGAFLDDISISAGGTTVTDGAENGANGWTAKGWKVTTGTETVTTPQYYLLENRAYVGYDKTLKQGPYNFSEAVTRPNWVEYLPYQDGMLAWYVDYAYADNNTSVHPGHGYALPVDARPKPFKYNDGTMPGNRRQPFDATFGRQRTDGVCLHKQIGLGQSGTYRTATACAPSSAGIPTFDDSNPDAYYSKQNPMNSTKVGGFGVRATVSSQDGQFMTVKVVNPANN